MSKQILPPSFKHALSQGFAPLGQFVASLLQAMGRGAARIVRSMDALASRIMKTADKHADEREFLPAALEIIDTPMSPIAKGLIRFICFGFTLTLFWAWFGYLDIYAIAQGKIQPQGRSKVVQPQETGIVSKLFVENGQIVKADDIVAELDDTEIAAESNAVRGDFIAAHAEMIRRRHIIDFLESRSNQPLTMPHFDQEIDEAVRRREIAVMLAEYGQLTATLMSLEAQINEKRAQTDRLNMTINSRTQLIHVLKERVDTRQIIDDKQQGFRARVIDALQEYLREQTSLTTDQGQLEETMASIQSLERRIELARNEFLSDQNQKLNEIARKRDRLSQERIKLDNKRKHMILRAPIDGTIQQLAITTLGQVVSGGQALMTVVPTGNPLEVEAMVLNSDIGFVTSDQPATIKVDAFPFTRFGTLNGRVSKVSREAVDTREASGLADSTAVTRPQGMQAQNSAFSPAQTLVFPITVSLEKTSITVEHGTIPLQPGMAVTVEIKTGERRAIDYLLSPLREIISSTAHER
jgi:hemolysin D